MKKRTKNRKNDDITNEQKNENPGKRKRMVGAIKRYFQTRINNGKGKKDTSFRKIDQI